MIKELINFTEGIDSDVFSWNIKPSNGLHILLKMNNSKNFEEIEYLFFSNKKSYDEADFDLEKITTIETYGKRIGTNMNKAFHKKLFACNPFIISFKKKNYSELKPEDFNSFFKVAKRIAKLNSYEEIVIEKFKDEVLRIKQKEIKEYKIKVPKNKKTNETEKESKQIFTLLGKDDYINFYLVSFPNEKDEIQDTDFKKYHDRYLQQKGFNQDKVEFKLGQIKKGSDEKYVFHNSLFQKLDGSEKPTIENKDSLIEEYNGYSLQNNFGISDYLNGLNPKKPYLEHKTAMFHKGISQFIDGDMANALIKFEQLVTVNRILPNPLPIMIWNENKSNYNSSNEGSEQNVFLKEYKENISIIKDKEIRIGFTEILKKIFEKNESFKLSNFYLFNFAGGKLRDFDFVEEFQFEIEGLEIKNVFGIADNEKLKTSIKNVFDFERQLVLPLFDNGLVTEYSVEDKEKNTTHHGYYFKYLDDLKDSSYSGKMFLLVSKYRRAFYDFIYKSQRNALNASIIEEILSVGLIDDITKDEIKNGKHSNQCKIHKKLNIWFSVYDFFLNNKNNQNNMASKIEQFKNDLIEIIKGNRSLQDGEDELFAFVAGQVVYYIQSKTKSADKSYARLEPFLNKSGAKEFKSALKEEFEKYKHERYSNEFNNPFSQVNVFPLSRNMKELLPFFIGGFFFKNLLFPGAINENKTN